MKGFGKLDTLHGIPLYRAARIKKITRCNRMYLRLTPHQTEEGHIHSALYRQTQWTLHYGYGASPQRPEVHSHFSRTSWTSLGHGSAIHTAPARKHAVSGYIFAPRRECSQRREESQRREMWIQGEGQRNANVFLLTSPPWSKTRPDPRGHLFWSHGRL